MIKILLPFAVLLGACGCVSFKNAYQSSPLYSEFEIKAKSWGDDSPNPTRFMGWSVVGHRLRGKSGELIIVKYGDAAKGKVTCLEFYKPVAPPDSGSHQAFALVGRDARLDAVSSVIPVVNKDAVTIEITREAASSGPHPKKRILYVLCYTKDFTLQPALSELVFPVSE